MMTAKPRRTSLYLKPEDDHAYRLIAKNLGVSLSYSQIYRLGLIILLRSVALEDNDLPGFAQLLQWALSGPGLEIAIAREGGTLKTE